MKGNAPGWQVRGTGCGRTRDAAEVGIIRIGARSRGKFTVIWCTQCHRLRCIAIERKPPQADQTAALSADA